jgi:hypothetical protein
MEKVGFGEEDRWYVRVGLRVGKRSYENKGERGKKGFRVVSSNG